MSPASPPRPAARRRSKRLLFGLCTAALCLALTVTPVEAFLRVADPIGRNYLEEFTRYRLGALDYAFPPEWRSANSNELPPGFDPDGALYRHKRNLDLDLGSFRLRTNALGFRGPPVEPQKPADTFRILVLGDSVAFGWGVNDEQTFLRRLESELNGQQDGRRYEVINTGHPMYDSTQELAVLRDEGLALQPDLVLLVYVVNDIEPTRDVVEGVLHGAEPYPEERLVIPGDAWTWLADRMEPLLPATAALLRLQSNEAARIARALPPDTEYVPELVGKGPRGWQRSQAALLAIRDLCARAKVPLLLLDQCMPALRALPGFCSEHGIDYADLRFTAAELARPIRNSRLDTHCNASGHELLLRKLQAALAARPLLPR